MTAPGLPSPAQKRLLHHVQDTAKQSAGMLADLRFQLEFVDLPPQSWFVAFQRLQDLGRELYGLGEEAGIATSWIEHARDKGERGISWRENYQGWPTPEPLDRDSVVDLLTQRARALRELVVADAVSRDGAPDGREPNQTARQQIIVERDRLAALAALADLDDAEHDRVWPAHRGWAYETAASRLSWDTRALAAWWREFHSDPARTDARRQAELLRVLDIHGSQDISVVPSVTELLDMADAAVRSISYPTEHLSSRATSPSNGVSDGVEIDDAVIAALPADADVAAPGPPERSSPADVLGERVVRSAGAEP